MQDAQSENISDQENQNLTGEVMDSLGEPEGATDQLEAEEQQESDEDQLPKYAKEKIGKLQKRYNRDMRRMEARISALQNQGGNMLQSSAGQPSMGQEQFEPGGVDDQIHKAVSYALAQKDAQERQAQEHEKHVHVQRKYQELQDHLDNAADNYDDFDEVVRDSNAPFTESMRDTALLLPNAADVLYKLGKNTNELSRIAKLHPIDQAKEMIKLSHSLAAGQSKNAQQSRPLSQIKNSPVTSRGGVNDNTPVGELRRRLKAGWK